MKRLTQASPAWHKHMEQLTLPGTLESLKAIRDCVLAAGGVAGLDRRALYRLQLAVDEIATNIVTHGYAEAGITGMLDVWTSTDEQSLTVFVEDTGAPYDFSPSLPEDADLPLEQRQIGGLGLLLAAENVDQFRYERRGDRNRHTFVVNRPSALSG